VRSLARLCIIANFVGVLAFVLVLSIMNGFRDSQEKKLLAVEPHLVIEGAGAADKFEMFLQSGDSRLSADDVTEIAPFEKQDVIVRTIDGLFSGGVAKGLQPQYLAKMLERAYLAQARGESPEIPQFDLGANEVVMGAELARNLGVYEGDEVTFVAPESLLLPAGEIPPFEKVRVANILTSDIADIDGQMIFYDQTKSLGRLKKTSSFETGIEVRLLNPSDAVDWKDIIVAAPAFNNGGKYEVGTWGDRNSALFFALKMEKYAMSTFLFLSILITTFALFTVLIMLITQKRKDIGLLMSLGLSRRRTQRLFVSVGAFLAFSGMFLGLLVGVGVATAIGHFSIPLLPDIYVDSRLPARVDWEQMGFIALGLMVLGLAAAYLPVRTGMQMSPSDALRGRK
jgi:lipoprotein-releasing system permease protein